MAIRANLNDIVSMSGAAVATTLFGLVPARRATRLAPVNASRRG